MFDNVQNAPASTFSFTGGQFGKKRSSNPPRQWRFLSNPNRRVRKCLLEVFIVLSISDHRRTLLTCLSKYLPRFHIWWVQSLQLGRGRAWVALLVLAHQIFSVSRVELEEEKSVIAGPRRSVSVSTLLCQQAISLRIWGRGQRHDISLTASTSFIAQHKYRKCSE